MPLAYQDNASSSKVECVVITINRPQQLRLTGMCMWNNSAVPHLEIVFRCDMHPI